MTGSIGPAARGEAAAFARRDPFWPAQLTVLAAIGLSLDLPSYLTIRAVWLIPAIEATTAALLDAVAGQTEFDLVAALAFPLPANIVFSLMGVPEDDYAQLKQWCGYRAALGWGRPALCP